MHKIKIYQEGPYVSLGNQRTSFYEAEENNNLGNPQQPLQAFLALSKKQVGQQINIDNLYSLLWAVFAKVGQFQLYISLANLR